jgi:hypothetical protein
VPLSQSDTALQEEGADLINDASALTDQTLTYAMQGLQIELICRLHGDELHRGLLHGLGESSCRDDGYRRASKLTG